MTPTLVLWSRHKEHGRIEWDKAEELRLSERKEVKKKTKADEIAALSFEEDESVVNISEKKMTN